MTQAHMSLRTLPYICRQSTSQSVAGLAKSLLLPKGTFLLLIARRLAQTNFETIGYRCSKVAFEHAHVGLEPQAQGGWREGRVSGIDVHDLIAHEMY